MSHKQAAPVIEQEQNGYGASHVVNGLANGQCNGGLKNGLKKGMQGDIKPKAITLPQLHMQAASLEQGYQFLNSLIPVLLKEALVDGTNLNSKVLEFRHPAELMKTVDLHLSNTPVDNNELMEACRDIIKYSVRTGHPHFFNQLFGGMDMYGMAGAWLTESLNASAYTYEVSPVFTLMEKTVCDEMLKFTGFPDGGDGIFCPGGSISNMYAINLARYKKFPDIKRTGMSGMPPLVVFTSERGHYSIAKGASLLGFGSDNVIKVKTDETGRMIPEELEKEIMNVTAEGRLPLIVNATQGSTVLGSYDPLEPIADICSKYHIWLHADGAWGGAVLLSDKLRSKMKGIERCDSMTWNPHKMMGCPLQGSAFLTKHKNLLSECHSAKAKYLFQQDKFYDTTYDTGDKSIQCGRKVDCLKVWLMWKAKGTQQFAKEIENIFSCAQYLTKKLKNRDGFRLVLEEPECTNVCFWYIPPSLRGQDENTEWWNKVSKVAPMIKQRMMEQGTMLVGYQPDGSLVNFFRMVVSNTHATHDDMDFVINEIERLGIDL